MKGSEEQTTKSPKIAFLPTREMRGCKNSKDSTLLFLVLAVERLFAVGSDILRSKRSSMTKENFEKFVLLRENEKCLKKLIFSMINALFLTDKFDVLRGRLLGNHNDFHFVYILKARNNAVQLCALFLDVSEWSFFCFGVYLFLLLFIFIIIFILE